MFARTLLILAFLCSSIGSAQSAQVLRLVANEWEPYTGSGMLNKGLASDIVVTALRRAGYEISIHIVPWTRAVQGTKAGTYDGIIAIWYTDERAQTMAYSQNYLTNDVVLFKREDQQITYQNITDLEGYNIGTVRDYAYGEKFDDAPKLIRKDALDLRTNVVRLAKGLVDLVPEDRFVMAHTLNQNYPEYRNKIGVLDKPLSQRKLHMTISRKTANYQKIIEDFNREFASMREEGLLKMMVNKHHLEF